MLTLLNMAIVKLFVIMLRVRASVGGVGFCSRASFGGVCFLARASFGGVCVCRERVLAE